MHTLFCLGIHALRQIIVTIYIFITLERILFCSQYSYGLPLLLLLLFSLSY